MAKKSFWASFQILHYGSLKHQFGKFLNIISILHYKALWHGFCIQDHSFLPSYIYWTIFKQEKKKKDTYHAMEALSQTLHFHKFVKNLQPHLQAVSWQTNTIVILPAFPGIDPGHP